MASNDLMPPACVAQDVAGEPTLRLVALPGVDPAVMLETIRGIVRQVSGAWERLTCVRVHTLRLSSVIGETCLADHAEVLQYTEKTQRLAALAAYFGVAQVVLEDDASGEEDY